MLLPPGKFNTRLPDGGNLGQLTDIL